MVLRQREKFILTAKTNRRLPGAFRGKGLRALRWTHRLMERHGMTEKKEHSENTELPTMASVWGVAVTGHLVSYSVAIFSFSYGSKMRILCSNDYK